MLSQSYTSYCSRSALSCAWYLTRSLCHASPRPMISSANCARKSECIFQRAPSHFSVTLMYPSPLSSIIHAQFNRLIIELRWGCFDQSPVL